MRCLDAARHGLGNLVDGGECTGSPDFPSVDGYTSYDDRGVYTIQACPSGQPGTCVRYEYDTGLGELFPGRYDGSSAWMNLMEPNTVYVMVCDSWGKNGKFTRLYMHYDAGADPTADIADSDDEWNDMVLEEDTLGSNRACFGWRVYGDGAGQYWYIKNIEIRPKTLAVKARTRPAYAHQVQTRRHYTRRTLNTPSQG